MAPSVRVHSCLASEFKLVFLVWPGIAGHLAMDPGEPIFLSHKV